MNESIMDRLRDIVLFVAGVIAVGSLILAAFEGFSQRIASAVFLGTLGVVCTFMVFMPKLEVFKVWGVEARLNKTLDRAEEILSKVQRLSAISARVSYMTIAWGNRMGSPSAKDKQAVLDQIDAQLADLKVAPDERTVITRPFVRMIGFDYYQLFVGVMRQYAILKNSDKVAAVHAKREGAEEASRIHSDKIGEWNKRNENKDPFSRLETYSLKDELDSHMPKPGEWLDEKEIRLFDGLKHQILRFNEACEKKGGYTPEAAEFHDRYSKHNIDKAKELWAERQK